jgi:hypothetical protein
MRCIWTILILAALGGCSHMGPWTVLEGPQAEKLREPCSREFPEGLTGRWTPTAKDVAEPEAALTELINAEFRKRPWMSSQGPYLRQYAGFERGGRKVVYVNAVADANDSWRTKAVDICDGGAIAFGAVFDPMAHRFDWFQTNGPYDGKGLPASR